MKLKLLGLFLGVVLGLPGMVFGQRVGLAQPGHLAGPKGPANFSDDKIIPNLVLSNYASVSTNANVPADWSGDFSADSYALPPGVPDPLESFNRGTLALNKGILVGFVKPTGRVYRYVVFKPVRRGISNIGHNLTYPGRLLNNMLQGRWQGAHDETDRFFWNTFVGIGGFFDAATWRKIPRSEADFGETFGKWGWHPQLYLMLPIFGPSNDRDGVGLIGDSLDSPITYFSPWSYIPYGIAYNNLTDTADEYVRYLNSESDAYSELQYAWGFARETKKPDFTLKGKQDASSLETIQSVFFTYKNPEFPNYARTESALIPATGKKLKFLYWLQPKKAPIVYLVPGLGSHRFTAANVALAELVYSNGFSVACVSSPYHPEFMENASTAAMPAYTPIDVHDLHVALTQIDRRLEKLYPGRIDQRALMGYSMGAFESLYLAGTDATTNREPLIEFDRYVAINPPVRLLNGVGRLDECYRAPLEWPAPERTADLENTFLKVAAISTIASSTNPVLPFSAVESKFLIGLTFRFILRDIIYSSQTRHNQGILKQPLNPHHRAPVYNEILQYSYKDYFEKFVIPWYKTQGIDLTDNKTLAQASDLRTESENLKKKKNIRIITNRDDFLISKNDYDWFCATFPTEDLVVYERGGHLGNLSHPAVQAQLVKALDGLGAVPLNPKK